MVQPYVYISYSRDDREFVGRLNDHLRRAGVETWLDLTNIEPGDSWQKELERAIAKSTVVLFVVGKTSSTWRDAEVNAALALGKRVIPLTTNNSAPVNIPEPLLRVPWVNFRADFGSAFEHLLELIRDLQGATPLSVAERQAKGYVFLSYADEDAAFVSDLKGFLKNQGYAYWDFQESDRNYQVDYTIELEEVIKGAAGTLSVVSPSWKRSKTAYRELHFSEEVGIPVFFLKVKEPGPTLAISGRTYVDFTREPDKGFRQLDAEMRRKGL